MFNSVETVANVRFFWHNTIDHKCFKKCFTLESKMLLYNSLLMRLYSLVEMNFLEPILKMLSLGAVTSLLELAQSLVIPLIVNTF